MLIENGAGQVRRGDCGYCETHDTDTIVPSALNQWFELLYGCYDKSDEGKSLAALVKEDWRLFDNPKIDETRAEELLAKVLGDNKILGQSFAPRDAKGNDKAKQWELLRDEMMHRNRWFLDEPLDQEHLADLLELLVAPNEAVKEISDLWYRARLLSDKESFSLDEMGAPPKHLAGHGRANPVGIPYLYLGSTETTAVSEVRPHTGEKACIATFRVGSIQAIDLRDPRKSVSPFILSDADEVMSLRSGLPLLERLGEELTKPVQPRSAAFEYIPSQYLCEFIKKQGYKGVIYRSSVSQGVNLALFSPELASPVETKVVDVESVTVNIKDAETPSR